MDVKTIARQKGMTMEQIAERLDITKGGLSKALNGNPTLKTLRSVAKILDVPVTAFFADETSAPAEDDGEETVIIVSRKVKTIKIKLEDDQP